MWVGLTWFCNTSCTKTSVQNDDHGAWFMLALSSGKLNRQRLVRSSCCVRYSADAPSVDAITKLFELWVSELRWWIRILRTQILPPQFLKAARRPTMHMLCVQWRTDGLEPLFINTRLGRMNETRANNITWKEAWNTKMQGNLQAVRAPSRSSLGGGAYSAPPDPLLSEQEVAVSSPSQEIRLCSQLFQDHCPIRRFWVCVRVLCERRLLLIQNLLFASETGAAFRFFQLI